MLWGEYHYGVHRFCNKSKSSLFIVWYVQEQLRIDTRYCCVLAFNLKIIKCFWCNKTHSSKDLTSSYTIFFFTKKKYWCQKSKCNLQLQGQLYIYNLDCFHMAYKTFKMENVLWNSLCTYFSHIHATYFSEWLLKITFWNLDCHKNIYHLSCIRNVSYSGFCKQG